MLPTFRDQHAELVRSSSLRLRPLTLLLAPPPATCCMHPALRLVPSLLPACLQVQYLLQLSRLERQRYFLTQHNPGEWCGRSRKHTEAA